MAKIVTTLPDAKARAKRAHEAARAGDTVSAAIYDRWLANTLSAAAGQDEAICAGGRPGSWPGLRRRGGLHGFAHRSCLKKAYHCPWGHQRSALSRRAAAAHRRAARCGGSFCSPTVRLGILRHRVILLCGWLADPFCDTVSDEIACMLKRDDVRAVARRFFIADRQLCGAAM
jgi:hypothetical protein